MRTYLKVAAVCFILPVFFSCKDEEKDLQEKGYSLFCWPSKTPCDNREYGIEFSYRKIVISPAGVTTPRVATLVCCQYIEPLMDSLRVYNDSLKNHRDHPLGSFSRRCRIGPDIEVHVDYSFSMNAFKPSTFSTLGFSDLANPYGFDLWLPQFEYFDAFYKDVMEMYRKCCLREEDE